jgi:hypothetical protein
MLCKRHQLFQNKKNIILMLNYTTTPNKPTINKKPRVKDPDTLTQ